MLVTPSGTVWQDAHTSGNNKCGKLGFYIFWEIHSPQERLELY